MTHCCKAVSQASSGKYKRSHIVSNRAHQGLEASRILALKVHNAWATLCVLGTQFQDLSRTTNRAETDRTINQTWRVTSTWTISIMVTFIWVVKITFPTYPLNTVHLAFKTTTVNSKWSALDWWAKLHPTLVTWETIPLSLGMVCNLKLTQHHFTAITPLRFQSIIWATRGTCKIEVEKTWWTIKVFQALLITSVR